MHHLRLTGVSQMPHDNENPTSDTPSDPYFSAYALTPPVCVVHERKAGMMSNKDSYRPCTAIITGGASGLGLTTAERLCRDGIIVITVDVDATEIGRASGRERSWDWVGAGALTGKLDESIAT